MSKLENASAPSVRAYSMPRPYAWLVEHGHVPTVDLVGVPQLPLDPDGLVVVLHAQEAYDHEVAAAWREQGIAVPGPETCPKGLVAFGVVRSVTWPHEGGDWMLELDIPVIGIRPPHDVKGFRGLYQLPDQLEHAVCRALEDAPVA